MTESERYELLVLMSIYQIGQVRKSAGLAEAVRRGLKSPLLYAPITPAHFCHSAAYSTFPSRGGREG
ncbi:MAG: hypothetical protein RID53_04895 [Coleofasciculus sp. B1-GNL1-01]|uniref:hypothetical protein n=1 Tax=Coleofasciculus sp. B1-GNL1-01 TaxID=3068484 RepID=UPI0032FA863B